ncbi:uncharacterized protein [Miscanthus floridulus]|uniref:uncharacterized protein n=1 Tax=Miscanthus floridulus TaxID=154761 RepID=UPI00345AF72F
MNLIGSVALWFQSSRASILAMKWDAFVLAVSNRFYKDEHNHLLRHFFHVKQTATVSEYIEQFSEIIRQLLAYDPTIAQFVITNRFVDGLKKEIRAVIMVHRHRDLDAASSLALLQEEASQDSVTRKSELGLYPRKTNQEQSRTPYAQAPNYNKTLEEKKGNEGTRTKTGEDKLFALKSFRRAKGLCFKCGEKWGPQHKCPTQVSLHAIEELWKWVSDEGEGTDQTSCDDSDSGEDLMAVSVQAMNCTEGFKTIRLRGHMNGKEVFMLVDSGSSHSFVDDRLATHISPWQPLPQSMRVKVANGGVISCTHELSQQLWAV